MEQPLESFQRFNQFYQICGQRCMKLHHRSRQRMRKCELTGMKRMPPMPKIRQDLRGQALFAKCQKIGAIRSIDLVTHERAIDGFQMDTNLM